MATSWFDKFLKLLGIEEDKPVSSNNAFSVTRSPAPSATPHTAEPAKPVTEEPVKNEPVKSEPVKSEPVKSEPVKSEPVKSEPEKSEPEKTEPETDKPAAEKPAAETVAKEEAQKDTVPEPEPEKASADSLQDAYPGLKANFVKVLTEAGFDSKAAIDKASDKELLALKGIGQATLKILRNK